jgi:uncharacterized membrane protein YhhN
VNASVVLLLVLMLTVAVVDWIAVHLQNKRLEYLAKPATMVFLIAAVLAMDTPSTTARTCFVVALAFSLLGDVFLMLPDRERWFVFGLGAFLIGHLAYIPGLWALGVTAGPLLVGLLIVVASMATLGRHIVTVYMLVISVMVASAIGTLRPAAIVGAVLFYCSDALIAWNGFIKEYAWGKVAIMVTYHLGQLGLALSLLG